MQQLQLWIFWAIVAAWVICGCILTRRPTKRHQRKPCDQQRRTNISLAVLLSKKKGALIGRAAGERYRPLKKLNQVCDPRVSLMRDEARRIAANIAKLPDLRRRPSWGNSLKISERYAALTNRFVS